jgi:hypothetical protein
MRLGRFAAVLVLLAMAATGCTDSDTAVYSPPMAYNRSHSSLDDYGRSTGYTDPTACWRSTSTATCF